MAEQENRSLSKKRIKSIALGSSTALLAGCIAFGALHDQAPVTLEAQETPRPTPTPTTEQYSKDNRDYQYRIEIDGEDVYRYTNSLPDVEIAGDNIKVTAQNVFCVDDDLGFFENPPAEDIRCNQEFTPILIYTTDSYEISVEQNPDYKTPTPTA
jgi:hypothetical protein